MGTLVCFHAHPDDEAIATGGTMARAAKEGHTVVLVVATGGEHGEVPGDLAPGETLADRRRRETEASCAELGVHHVEWLGYRDSGMTGWEQNGHDGAFVGAPVDEAAERLAAILRRYSAEVLTVYDWHGNYGHPDHVHVHKVVRRTAEMTGVLDLFEVTLNRDFFVEQFEWAKANGIDNDFDPREPADDGNPMGEPAANITHHIDVSAYVDHKRRAIAAHASQASDTGFATSMPDDTFLRVFGTEWFIKVGAAAPSTITSLLD